MSKIHTYDPRFTSLKKQQRNGRNAASMQRDNWKLILQLIYENGSISRKALAEKTGLQQATVTIIMNELLNQGLIKKNGMVDGGNGRKVQSFSMAENFYIISIRLTAVYIKVALFDIHVSVQYVEKIFFKTEDGVTEAKEIALEHIRRIESLVEKKKILCIIMGVEHKYRLIDDDYAIWDDVRERYCHIGRDLHDITQYRVFVNRAINYAAYDFWDRYKKEARLEDDYFMMVYIQLGYDLESVIIVNHEIIYGKNGRCGQLHDLPVDRESGLTCKETMTVPAILERVQTLLEQYPDSFISDIVDLNIRDIIVGYEKQDALCRQIYQEVIENMGYLISFILNWMDPDVVFLGDEIPSNEEFFESLRAEVARYAGEQKAKRVGGFILERKTRNDPNLIGAAKYGFDLMIGEIGIFS